MENPRAQPFGFTQGRQEWLCHKAPASQGCRYKSVRNPRGPGEPRPYKVKKGDGKRSQLKVAVTGDLNIE